MKLAHKVDQWIADYESKKQHIHEPKERYEVTTGSLAWNLFYFCRWHQVYDEDRSITDAHIKTALQKVFPNAVFKDKYQY